MIEELSPIAIFAYNRPHHLRRLFDSLTRCPEFVQSNVTVFVDGAKSASDLRATSEVFEFLRKLPHPNLCIRKSETNRGLRKSISDGVTEICRAYGRVVVLEDDLVLSPQALTFFNAALNKYGVNDRIWSVSGYVYHAEHLALTNTALVLPIAHPWGWATWQRAWSLAPADPVIDLEQIGAKSFQRVFDQNGLYKFTRLLQLAKEGLVDSWFIRWYYSMFLNDGLSIFPPRRLTKNYGIVGGGAHSGTLNPYNLMVPSPPGLMVEQVSFPDDLSVDYWALDLMKSSWETKVHRLISDGGALRRRVRARLR